MLGERLAVARQGAGMAQVDLAAAIEKDMTMISHVEANRAGLLSDLMAYRRRQKHSVSRRTTCSALPTMQRLPAADQPNATPVSHLATPERAAGARPIPVRELAAAAGGGAVDLDETILGYLYFRREWLDRRAVDATQADIIKVHGESMEPTLPDGCSILMDRRRAPRSGRIYVVRTDEGIVVKRARRDGGSWILSSDHPAWPPRPCPAGAELIGEVRWMAQTLEIREVSTIEYRRQ